MEAAAGVPSIHSRALLQLQRSRSTLPPLRLSTQARVTWASSRVRTGAITGARSTRAFERGSVSALAIDPTAPQTVYAGTPGGGGVFKSTDGGNNWKAINTGLTSTDVKALVIDPTAPQILYVGTDGNGVFRAGTAEISGLPSTRGCPTPGSMP